MCSVGLVRVSHCVFEMCELMVSVPMFHPRVLERLICSVVVRASRKWIHVLRVQWMSDVLFLWLRDFRWLHILFFRRRVREALSAVDFFWLEIWPPSFELRECWRASFVMAAVGLPIMIDGPEPRRRLRRKALMPISQDAVVAVRGPNRVVPVDGPPGAVSPEPPARQRSLKLH